MTEQRMRILKMLADGKISCDEAEELLDALGRAQPSAGGDDVLSAPTARPAPRYLRVEVTGEDSERVDVRVPLKLIEAGMKLSGFVPDLLKAIPADARERVKNALDDKGINLDFGKRASRDDMAAIIEALKDLSIDVVDGDERVRVYCE